MKSMKSMMMSGAILLGLAMCLTSCEGTLDDVFGEWSRPTGNNSKQGDSSTTNATAITLDQTMKVLVKGGDALTIKINFTPSDATDKTVTWESDDPTIATVENGVVTPVGLGITTITAKSGELSATCDVFVGNEVDLGASAYEAKNYDILKGNMGANQLTIPNDIKVAFNGVTTTQQIICQGTATIYLADGSENEVTVSSNKAGIQIGGEGTTLTINGETAGDGKLTVQGGKYAAGIGTNLDSAGGNIVINGGTVTATGSGGGAGIGTGETYKSTNKCGTITINGGTVTATGVGYAAGIGTGYAYDKTNTCGAITINGGTVNATGGYYAAGIGTGYAYDKTNTCGAITIGTGVTSVTAKKSSSNPGPNSIGIGHKESATQTCGTITIGGVVKDQSEFTGDTYTYTPSN